MSLIFTDTFETQQTSGTQVDPLGVIPTGVSRTLYIFPDSSMDINFTVPSSCFVQASGQVVYTYSNPVDFSQMTELDLVGLQEFGNLGGGNVTVLVTITNADIKSVDFTFDNIPFNSVPQNVTLPGILFYTNTTEILVNMEIDPSGNNNSLSFQMLDTICFPGDTLVSMMDGSYKQLDCISPGDKVLDPLNCNTLCIEGGWGDFQKLFV